MESWTGAVPAKPPNKYFGTTLREGGSSLLAGPRHARKPSATKGCGADLLVVLAMVHTPCTVVRKYLNKHVVYFATLVRIHSAVPDHTIP